jgi:hypothetical protein
MEKKIRDLKKVEKRERTFSTLAKIEGKGAKKRERSESKAGLKESAKDSRFEIKVDNKFAKMRENKANLYRRRLREQKGKG